jgi:hypothetical protein
VVYDPFTSRKYEGVLPVANGAAKISELAPEFESGTIVKANCDGKLNDKVLANLDEANLVWIKSTSSDSMTVVPFNASAECKICANEYVDFHTATLFKDIYGKEHNSNVVGITDETVFSDDRYEMNWLRSDYPYAEVKSSKKCTPFKINGVFFDCKNVDTRVKNLCQTVLIIFFL